MLMITVAPNFNRVRQSSAQIRSDIKASRSTLCSGVYIIYAAVSRVGLCLLILTIFPGHLFSSTGTPSDLDQLIARIEARYGNMRGLAADFEQTYSGPGVRDKHERGRLFLQRPKRMRWEYEPKPGRLFVVNDREVWFYSPADREATRADAAKISDARFPFLFLLGQKNLRRQFRTIAFASLDRGPSGSTRILSLIPKSTDTGVREIRLEVTTEGQIVKVRQTDEAYATSEIKLLNVQENTVAPAEAFQFHPPPGVNVRRQK